jgi:hypothetical protein
MATRHQEIRENKHKTLYSNVSSELHTGFGTAKGLSNLTYI